MDSIEYIRQLITGVRNQTDDSLKDTTAAQFNWAPPGTASPISAVLIHLLTSEDFFVHEVLQGKLQQWEQGGWGEKTGVKNTPDYGGNWEEFKKMTLSLEPVLAYRQAVRAATDAYLDSLTPEMLAGKVKFADGESTVAGMITILVCHTLCHAGEIAALKGVQGGKGLPY